MANDNKCEAAIIDITLIILQVRHPSSGHFVFYAASHWDTFFGQTGALSHSSELLPTADQTDTAVLRAPVAIAPVLGKIKRTAHVRLPNVRKDIPRCVDGALQIVRGGVHWMQ